MYFYVYIESRGIVCVSRISNKMYLLYIFATEGYGCQ